MGKKRTLAYAVITAILAALIYMQFRTWKNFDWPLFWGQFKLVIPLRVFNGVLLIYISHWLRARRWKIFLRRVRKDVSSASLFAPTLIGFAGLALLGRAGELIRPYLIARRTHLSFSSQLAAWAVERIFDVGAFTVLMVLAIFIPTQLRSLPDPEIYPRLRVAGFLLVALVAGLTLGAVTVAKYGEALAAWVERRFSRVAADAGHRLAQRLREFQGGLDTIHSPLAFLELSVVSVVTWWIIALAYREVIHGYGPALGNVKGAQVLLLTGSSMLGSLIQLPGVGGGSQLATISALQHIFHASHELAASCGILLWLVTFVSIVPAGLLLAHRERLSLRRLSEESEQEETHAEFPAHP
jgi:uncharacterized protein (TIRG00374 family)